MSVTAVDAVATVDAGHAEPTPAGEVDFDLHGMLGVRLVNAPADARAGIEMLLGPPLPSRIARHPDIVIRFADQPFSRSDWRYVDSDAAFGTDHFFVLNRRGAGVYATQLPWEQLGGPCCIACEPGVRVVPLLMPIINLTMLGKGVLPVHGSAFTYQGKGVLVAGWRKGGKSETLLAFMAHGADYVGDEWVFISPDGRRLFGLPLTIRVWDWHLRSMPHYRARLSRSTRTRLSWTRQGRRVVSRLLARSKAGSPSSSVLGRLESRFDRELGVDVPPGTLFGRGRRTLSAGFDRLILAMTRDGAAVEAAPIAAEEVAARMAFSLQAERRGFIDRYLSFRFAFPDRPNRFLEQVETVERDLLRSAFAGKNSHAVFHPSPMRLEDLFDVVRPLISL
jgi:hypothetical protein